MLPILFMYGFIGMLVNDVTTRMRIAYAVRKIPKYDGSQNKCILIGLSICIIFYANSSMMIYSSRHIFWNEVAANKSHSVYNAPSKNQMFNFDKDPALLYNISYLVLLVIVLRYLGRCAFYHYCPESKCFAKLFKSKLWELRNTEVTMGKDLNNFYDSLSDE